MFYVPSIFNGFSNRQFTLKMTTQNASLKVKTRPSIGEDNLTIWRKSLKNYDCESAPSKKNCLSYISLQFVTVFATARRNGFTSSSILYKICLQTILGMLCKRFGALTYIWKKYLNSSFFCPLANNDWFAFISNWLIRAKTMQDRKNKP